jgi:hypothetical protein
MTERPVAAKIKRIAGSMLFIPAHRRLTGFVTIERVDFVGGGRGQMSPIAHQQQDGELALFGCKLLSS